MYEVHFGLTTRPFTPAPRPDFYHPAAAIESARQSVLRCARRGEGTAVVVGPSGTGKSLLCHLVAQELAEQCEVVVLQGGRLSTRRALLQAILYGLRRPYRGMDEGELRLALLDYLVSGSAGPGAVVLLVDEAHTLPLKLLDELRMLTNLADNGLPRIRLALLGNPALEERLTNPRLEALTQHVVVRCYLAPLGQAETGDYIQAQVTKAGGAAELFGRLACEAVHRATDGVPRLVNQLCDHALLLAAAAGRRRIDDAAVDEAWADLQQLPAPSANRDAERKPAEVIEFGSLEDDAPAVPQVAEPSPCQSPRPSVSVDDDAEDALILAGPVHGDPHCGPKDHSRHVEGMLAEWDGQGPSLEAAEVGGSELFGHGFSPFAEEFQQEELVEDRYARLTQRRHEDTVEMVSSHAEPFAAATPGRAPGATAAVVAPPGAYAWQESTAGEAPRIVQFRSTTIPHRPSLALAAEIERLAAEPPADEADDTIVVEDHYDDQPTCLPVRAVKRRCYRQLFTRLRCG